MNSPSATTGLHKGALYHPFWRIYLHYVLDLWFEKRYANTCKGRAYLVRYADDFIGCFTNEDDARRFKDERLRPPGGH